MALVGSVAAAVLCLGGFGAVIAGAGPGDPLYGLRTMLFGEQQQTREDQVMLASQQLAEVQQLIDEGQWDAAQEKLQTLTTTVATVNDVEQKQELVTQWQEMTVKVESQDAERDAAARTRRCRYSPTCRSSLSPGLDTDDLDDARLLRRRLLQRRRHRLTPRPRRPTTSTDHDVAHDDHDVTHHNHNHDAPRRPRRRLLRCRLRRTRRSNRLSCRNRRLSG